MGPGLFLFIYFVHCVEYSDPYFWCVTLNYYYNNFFSFSLYCFYYLFSSATKK